jgi:hypothetical protein
LVSTPWAKTGIGAIDQVQQRHGQDEAAEEPVGDVDVLTLRLTMVPKNTTA